MTCHYAQLGSDSDWLKQISHAARSIKGKHYPDLACDTLSVWSLCALFSDVISRPGKPRREMSVVFRLRLTRDYRHLVNPASGLFSMLRSDWLSYY